MSLSAKRSYKFIAIFLCFCLIVCMMPRPDAHAIAGVDDALLGAGVCMFLAALAGYTFDNHGDFKAACQECFNQMSDNMKDAILSNCTMSGGALQVGALVAAAEFHNIWNHVKEFFSVDNSGIGSVVLPSNNNLSSYVSQSILSNPPEASRGDYNSLYVPASLINTSDIIHLPLKSTSDVTFTNILGENVTFHCYWTNTTNSKALNIDCYIGDREPTHTSYFEPFILLYKFGARYYVTFSSLYYNSSRASINLPGNNSSYYDNLCIDISSISSGGDTIDFSSDPVIPVDPVYDALIEKSTSTEGISISEDTSLFKEMFGDIADDVAQIADQVQALTDTAVLEAVDEAYYTDPDDITVPRLPFFPGDFSGFGSIWHYVEEWLSSIGGFISLILNVWSSLPYIIVVPVYASVVLILIFGVYRKFIA